MGGAFARAKRPAILGRRPEGSYIREMEDSPMRRYAIDGGGGYYQNYRKANPENKLETNHKSAMMWEVDPDVSQSRKYFSLPTGTGFDELPLEDRISLLYTTNSFLDAEWRVVPLLKHPLPVVTYVHAALDNPEDVSFNPEYEDAVLARARELFTNPELFSPEAFSELRRVGNRLSLYHKYKEYDLYMHVLNLDQFMEDWSVVD